MEHQSMRNGSRVAEEMNLIRGCLALDDFLLFFLYKFSGVA
jgi:hypothetical protein